MANAYYKNGSSWINMANVFYPVGAYYLANTSTSPSSLFGGTWNNLTGRFLYCNNGTAQNGENSHILTIAEMPSHGHDIYTGSVKEDGNVDIYWGGGNRAARSPSTTWYSVSHEGGICKLRGNSSAHNNMPAYRTCYCWYRTA